MPPNNGQKALGSTVRPFERYRRGYSGDLLRSLRNSRLARLNCLAWA